MLVIPISSHERIGFPVGGDAEDHDRGKTTHNILRELD